MRKIFSLLAMLAVLLTSTAALAAYKETVTPGADISAVKRLAIALPMHYKVDDAEPTVEEFTKIIFDASKATRLYVISCDEIAKNILSDTGVDIKQLNDLESRRIYNANVGKYADAFLTVTTINDEPKVQFFFEVKNSQTGVMMYVLTTQSRELGRNSKDYLKACEEFYKRFDAAVTKNLKELEKAAKKKSKQSK